MTNELLQQALDLRSEALEIFDGPECAQMVRDAIEWYHNSLLVMGDRAAIAQQEHPTAAMQIAGGAVLLDYINENEAESEKRVGSLTAARVFIAMQKASTTKST